MSCWFDLQFFIFIEIGFDQVRRVPNLIFVGDWFSCFSLILSFDLDFYSLIFISILTRSTYAGYFFVTFQYQGLKHVILLLFSVVPLWILALILRMVNSYLLIDFFLLILILVLSSFSYELVLWTSFRHFGSVFDFKREFSISSVPKQVYYDIYWTR